MEENQMENQVEHRKAELRGFRGLGLRGEQFRA